MLQWKPTLQLCPTHTIFVSCLFAFDQAVPFSHFLFILLFSLTFWSLLADMHSINYYMTAAPAWMRRGPSFHGTSAALYSCIYCSLFSASVPCLVLASSWVLGRQILCLFHLHIISAQGQLWANSRRHLLFLGWGEEKEWVGGWTDGALKGNTTRWA